MHSERYKSVDRVPSRTSAEWDVPPLPHPELRHLIFCAVGFRVAVVDKGALVHGIRTRDGRANGLAFQVMRADELPGRGLAFWSQDWYTRPQFHPTPLAAAVAFVDAWHRWLSEGGDPS